MPSSEAEPWAPCLTSAPAHQPLVMLLTFPFDPFSRTLTSPASPAHLASFFHAIPQPFIHCSIEGRVAPYGSQTPESCLGPRGHRDPQAHCMPCSGVARGLRPPQATHPQGLACGWPQLMTQEIRPAPCFTLKCHMKDPTGAEQSQRLHCQWALSSGADREIRLLLGHRKSPQLSLEQVYEGGRGEHLPRLEPPFLVSHPRPDPRGWQSGKSPSSGQVTEALWFDPPFCESGRITPALSTSQTSC